MKKIAFIFIITCIISLCANLTVAQNVTRIMPLGDSITAGYIVGLTAGDMNGYRQKLYSDLINAGFNVDFVGSLNYGYLVQPSFDFNNEGHLGWRDNEIAGIVFSWLEANPPDVVLLHVGTNSPNPSPNDVEDILDEIDLFSKDIIVVLALIINNGTFDPVITEFNNNVRAMAEARIANCDKIIIVDMEHALIYPDDMSDNQHPNSTGYSKMADVWFNALQPILTNSYQPACSTPTPTPVPDSDLKAYYTLDEETEALAIDSSPFSRHGAIFGATWTTAKDGNGLSFDGIDDYVSVPLAAAANAAFDNIYTVSAWVYVLNTINTQIIVSATDLNGGGDANTIMELSIYNGNFKFIPRAYTTISATNSPGWHHLVGVRNGSTAKFFVDGVLRGTASGLSATLLRPLSFNFGKPHQNIYYFNGVLDDVRIYTSALSDQEVQNLYNLFNSSDTTPPVISTIQEVVSDTEATITWVTDEPATSKVDYGITTGYGSSTVDNTLMTSHTIVLTGLTADTFYHYQITSADSSGNTAVSVDRTFTTTNSSLQALYTLDEGVGISAIDSSGNSYNGTINGAAWTSGKSGGGLSFDGIDDYVSVPLAAAANAASDNIYTLSAWVYVSNTIDTQIIVSATDLNGGGDANTIMELSIYNGNFKFIPRAYTTISAANSPGWHHLVGVRNGSTAKFFVDGVLRGTASGLNATLLRPLSFNFGKPHQNKYYFNGVLDDVRIYTSALSDQEVQDLYNEN